MKLNKNLKLVTGFLIGFFITIFIILFICSIIFHDNCYEDKAILNNQYVGDLSECCDDCLIFNVTEFICKGKPGDGCGCEWKNRMLCFENEKQIRTDLLIGSEIKIKWCFIEDIQDYRVRGINKW